MKVKITNIATYSREVQYFRKNQFEVLNSGESLEVSNVSDPLEISFYESLNSCGFSVVVSHDDTNENLNSQSDDDTGEVVSGVSEVDLSKFSEDELKRIVKNLRVETRARARWKLERLVLENLPRDTSPESYL